MHRLFQVVADKDLQNQKQARDYTYIAREVENKLDGVFAYHTWLHAFGRILIVGFIVRFVLVLRRAGADLLGLREA